MKLTPIFYIVIVGVPVLALLACMLAGCAANGRPMRIDPAAANKKSLSWYIEGKAKNGKTISCSFVEFDERGDFIDFRQHQDCENRITKLVGSGQPVLLVMYCHGWKNNSQSDDVINFNSFLAKIAASPEVDEHGYRVHGVYLSWRGNSVHPYVDKSEDFYKECTNDFGEPIVDPKYDRNAYWTGFVQENVNFFTRQRAAEHMVSGLPMARAIFTYASAAKDYGNKLTNQVIVMGHSMGALMLERSLGQAMTGSLVMEWWEGLKNQAASQQAPVLPFDFILFLNSAAPSIYAKEMRDFLEANRASHRYSGENDYPVIISLTSTADSATGKIYPLAHCLCPLKPSLKRKYTTGIFGTNGQEHAGIRQWKFYLRTPGHQPYLVNHWIVPETGIAPMKKMNSDDVFATNISRKIMHDPYVFLTSTGTNPAAWRITKEPPKGRIVTLDGLPLAMQNSDYWIMNCDKELIASHGDIWSEKQMEMYAGLYRLAAYLKRTPQTNHFEAAPGQSNLSGSQ